MVDGLFGDSGIHVLERVVEEGTLVKGLATIQYLKMVADRVQDQAAISVFAINSLVQVNIHSLYYFQSSRENIEQAIIAVLFSF